MQGSKRRKINRDIKIIHPLIVYKIDTLAFVNNIGKD